MKSIRSVVLLSVFAFVGSARAISQQAIPPPPNPSEAGPSLEVTLNFIRDKLLGQGTIEEVTAYNFEKGVRHHTSYKFSSVVADLTACTLQFVQTVTDRHEVPDGMSYKEGPDTFTGQDMTSTSVYTDTVSLKDLDKITIENEADRENGNYAKMNRTDMSVSVTPAVFSLWLHSPKSAVVHHWTHRVGNGPAKDDDFTNGGQRIEFLDEELTDRIAKAFTHAIELCGGGNKDPF